MIHIKRREQLDFGYELFIAAVSILSVFNMLLAYIPGVDQDAINVVFIINAVLTLLFIYDFGIRLATAPSRSSYFFRDYGWADLLACIPQFRIFRMFRIYKAYRLVKKYGVQYIISFLSTNRAAAALYILVLMVIIIIESGDSWSFRRKVRQSLRISPQQVMRYGGHMSPSLRSATGIGFRLLLGGDW